MPVDAAEAIAALNYLGDLVDAAARQIAENGAGIVRDLAKAGAPRGVPGNTTNAPGDLALSITTTPVVGSSGIFEASVGPHMIYSKQREFGGEIYAHNPSGLLTFTKFGVVYRPPMVYQEEKPYMRPAWAESLVPIEEMAIETLTIALEGV